MKNSTLESQKSFIKHWSDVRSAKQNTKETLSDLNRAIRELSDKLYSTKTHFLLELIQNADDNTYAAGYNPELTFVFKKVKLEGIERTCLLVHNNEVGFSEKNLEALFQIAHSTKTKKEGFIGEKGIGFKSVFSVTDCPYIYSSGYQFKLPEKVCMGAGVELGYIVPVWVDECPAFLKEGTNIILPIVEKKISAEKLMKELQNVSAEIILFLKQLNKISIIIDYDNNKIERVIYREFNPIQQTVTLCDQFTEDNTTECDKCDFLYKTKSIKKPATLNVEEREGITERDLTIAIPLNRDSYRGKLFAYLPVKEGTGLPFLINSDFLLASSRESIREDSSWNEWIWSEIPEFFAEIVENVICDGSVSMYTKFDVFKKIPIKAVERQYIRLVDDIHSKLKKKKCLLSYEDYEAVAPHECKRLSYNAKMLLEKIDWHPDFDPPFFLVANELEKHAEILTKLGVEKLSEEKIVDLLSDDFIENLDNEMLIELYLFLAKNKITSVRDYSWVPAATTEGIDLWVGGNGETIYYLADDVQRHTYLKKEYVKMFFLRPSLFAEIKKSSESEFILAFLRKAWGITSFSLENYCEALKKLLAEAPPANDTEFLEISEFIIKNNEFPNVFLTNNGRKSPRNGSIVVPPDFFENGLSWDLIWKSPCDQSHFSYLKGYTKESLKKLSSDSDSEILLYPYFCVENYRESHSKLSNNVQELWDHALFKAAESRVYETNVFFSVIPSGLQQIITPLQSKTIIAIFEYYLERNGDFAVTWSCDNEIPKYGLKNVAKYQNRGYHTEQADSDLIVLLKNTEWVPTTKGLKRPGAVWVSTNTVNDIFRGKAPTLNTVISKTLIRILGIKETPTAESLCEQIKVLSAGCENIDHEYALALYRASSLYGCEFSENDKFIFIPGSQKLWYNCRECLWNNETEILSNTFQYLSIHYKDPTLKEFFLEQGVQESANIEAYIGLWMSYQEKNDKLPVQLIPKLYIRLARDFQKVSSDEIWKKFCREARLITEQGDFKKAGFFLFADNSSYEKIFSNCANVQFTCIPSSGGIPIKNWRAFYKEFSVKSLSSCVSTHISEAAVSKSQKLKDNQILTIPCIKMIAAFLYEHSGNNKVFGKLYEKKILQVFRIQEYDMPEYFDLIYTLDHPNGEKFREKAKRSAHVDFAGMRLFAYRKANEWKRLLAQEIASYLSTDNTMEGFENFIELVLGEQNLDRIKEQKWCIPPKFEERIKPEDANTSINTDAGTLNVSHETPQNNTVITPNNTVSPNVPTGAQTSANDVEPEKGEPKPQGKTIPHKTNSQQPDDADWFENKTPDDPAKISVDKSAMPTSVTPHQHPHPAAQEQKNITPVCDTAAPTSNISQTGMNIEGSAFPSEESQEVKIQTPDFAQELDKKFSRKNNTEDNTSSEYPVEDEDAYEPLTEDARKRRSKRVMDELRQKQKEAENNISASNRKGANTCERASYKTPNMHNNAYLKQNDFLYEAFTAEERKVLDSLMREIPGENAKTLLTIAHKKDPAVRKDLEEHYHGKCQICHRTWRMANGQPFWIAAYLLPRGKGGVSHSGNAICLCAEHFAKWLHGSVLIENGSFISAVNAISGDSSNPKLPFKLAGEDVVLSYAPKHFCDLKTIVDFYTEEQEKTDKAAAPNHIQSGNTVPYDLILKAIENSCDESGFALLSAVGTNLIRMRPDFDVRLYGGSLASILRERPDLFEITGSLGTISVRVI